MAFFKQPASMLRSVLGGGGQFAGLSTAAGPSASFIEVREYVLKPEGFADYVKLCTEFAPTRKELLPFLGMFSCDLGGVMHRLTHLYHYKDFDERDRIRGAAAKDPRWAAFIAQGRKHVSNQTSKILLQATPIYEALQLPPTEQYRNPTPSSTGHKVVYEMRTYQLHPGYGSVPKLVDAFKKGLPDKVAADPERGNLVMFGYTDVGTLNNVVELWRYPSAQACIRARQSARTVPTWREAIAAVTPGVQHFTSEFLHPTSFSPWQ